VRVERRVQGGPGGSQRRSNDSGSSDDVIAVLACIEALTRARVMLSAADSSACACALELRV
jgi:hypothetical protein